MIIIRFRTEMFPFLNLKAGNVLWSGSHNGTATFLKGVGAVLKLEDQKMDEGKALIKYFSVPCAPTKINGGRSRNLPEDALDKWSVFKTYNKRDVEVEMGIKNRLANSLCQTRSGMNIISIKKSMIAVSASTWIWCRKAIEMDTRSRTELTASMKKTALDNPNSVQQMKQWLSKTGSKPTHLAKSRGRALKTASPELQTVLTLRQQLAKSSVRKYQTMERAACDDGRAHGCFAFYGANRTGRWAGRLIQLQNLPQNHLEDLSDARALVKSGDFDAVKMLYEDVPDTLSQLIRTAFIPKDGCQFYVSDFSAIEARVIAWYAGETWRQKVFEDGGDIYCASASQMFRVPVVKHGINGHLRQKAKLQNWRLAMAARSAHSKQWVPSEMGLSEDELPPLVDAWRQTNPRIVQFWWDVDRAVMEAVKYKHTTSSHGLTFSCRSGMLFITLPSAGTLPIWKPKVGTNKFGGECITYEGIGSTKKWERLDSYGPKFVENIVQATSRDILCYAMKTLRCCSIVMHIHDELVIRS